MQEKTDEELVYDFLRGDENALKILIQKYLNPVFRFVRRMVADALAAEDLTQEVFVRTWKNLKKFDRKKKFKTWIFSIAKNAAIDYLRIKKAIPLSAFEDSEGENSIVNTLADDEILPDEIAIRADAARQLSAALERLAPKYRLVLSLHYQEELTFLEMSEVLREPLNTVKSRLRRALIQLKKVFEQTNR